jgi:hypothetical protein
MRMLGLLQAVKREWKGRSLSQDYGNKIDKYEGFQVSQVEMLMYARYK